MKQNKIYIQNFWYVNNYGACLTAFALYQILEKLNYDVSLIDISQIYEKKIYIIRKKYINKLFIFNLSTAIFYTLIALAINSLYNLSLVEKFLYFILALAIFLIYFVKKKG